MPASYTERAHEISNQLKAEFRDDVPPRRLINNAADLCGVDRQKVIVTYAYLHPAEGGEFSVRVEVVLPIGRGQRVHGNGATPAEAIVDLGIALARFMDGEP